MTSENVYAAFRAGKPYRWRILLEAIESVVAHCPEPTAQLTEIARLLTAEKAGNDAYFRQFDWEDKQP